MFQGLQNATIESRTEMRLAAEVQEQEQRLKDFQLQMEQDRSKLSMCVLGQCIVRLHLSRCILGRGILCEL